MLLGITSSGKVGLAIMGGIFIVCALVASMVVPRRWPEFPGRRVGLFSLGVVVLFAAMITSVVHFAGEESAAETGTTGETKTAPTTTQPTSTATSTGTQPAGDAVAGKQIFETAGCKGCHTLADAGATGNVGPNLDDAKPSASLVVQRVTNGKGVMPSFKGQLSQQQIQDVAAYVSQAAGS